MARSQIKSGPVEVKVLGGANNRVERCQRTKARGAKDAVERYGRICALLTLAVMAHEHEPITVHGEALTMEEWSRWITAYTAVRIVTM